ncbi:CwfJ C-terminus 1-domain-containing protein-like protein [Gautieria morchelliformis]|nr:CwfJ C-terminus 1-domain-containing protein-like protein [Gautieria morchelliformis]
MATLKVLAVGSALGSFKSLFSKVKAIDLKHGKFEIVLATGDFFGPSSDGSVEDELNELLQDKLEVPIQVYIMQGKHPLPQAVIDKVKESGGQLCTNVFLLNKSGILSTAHGLRIACLGGVYAPEKYYGKTNGADLSNPYFTASTMKQLLSQPSLNPDVSKPGSLAAFKSIATFQFIDILLTHTWPTSMTVATSTMPPDLQPEIAPQLDDLVRKVKPRYHFTCGGKFWEREPFCWVEENNRTTRFVSLGSFGDQVPAAGKKERWFYAFSISSAAPPPTPQPPPPNAARNPFQGDAPDDVQTGKRSLAQTLEDGENHIWGSVEKRFKGSETGRGRDREHGSKSGGRPPEGYICRICNASGHFIRDCPQKNPLGDTGTRKPPEGYVCRACASDQHYIKDCPVAQNGPRERDRPRGPPREIQPDECWFCLSNPSVAKHLIVAIGSECYVTLPKGQVPPTQTPKPSPLAPIPGGGHVLIVPISHYPTLSSVPADLALPIVSEIEQFKSALRSCYAKFKSSPVTFEVARLTGKGGHAHVQVVPIPNSFPVDDVEAAFRSHGQKIGISFEEDADTALESAQHQNYFRVELPSGKKLVHLMRPGVPFDLQFGR